VRHHAPSSRASLSDHTLPEGDTHLDSAGQSYWSQEALNDQEAIPEELETKNQKPKD